MTRIILKNALRFLLLILVQVLILNNIQIRGFLIPQVYILFILLLPFETPKWLLLVLSFLTGLTVDLFSYTVGLHAAACTLIGFARPLFSRVIVSKQQYEVGVQPGISGLGFKWFLSYTLLLTSFHHLLVYFLEEFYFTDFITSLYRAILNILITTMVIVFTQLLITRQKGRS